VRRKRSPARRPLGFRSQPEADIAVVKLEGCARAEIDTMVSEGWLYAEPAVDEMKV
jgi:hypothetical protein